MMDMIKERGETVNQEDLYLATMDIKEKYSYVAKDIVEEFGKFDQKEFDEVNKIYSLSSKYKKYER
jgi:hypothetical protein